jgi:hypothetical protein
MSPEIFNKYKNINKKPLFTSQGRKTKPETNSPRGVRAKFENR